MNRLQRLYVLTATFLIGAPLIALSGLTPVEREENRRELAEIRENDPARYRQLRQATVRFLEMPKERRRQIAQLHERIERLPVADQVRLRKAMERYTQWLEQLAPSDRERVKNAPDRRARLQIIAELRQREWIARQPVAVQRKLARLQGSERDRAIRLLRAKEEMRRRQWAVARRFWKDLNAKVPLPASMEDLPRVTQFYVKHRLLPLLTPKEKFRLVRVRGEWPAFPKTLVELADKHYVELQGENGPRTHSDLPSNVQNFVQIQLSPHLSEEEKMELNEAEGKWPDYVRTLQDLADDHRLRIPWEHLPPRSRFYNWNLYRFGPLDGWMRP